LEHYLSLARRDGIRVFSVEIALDIRFRLWRVLTAVGRNYYDWVDSFITDLDERLSTQTFLKSIGWNTALTVIRCITPGENGMRPKAKRTGQKNVKRKS